MTTKITLFFFLTFLVIGCAKNRAIPLDIQCDENIRTATKLLENAGKEFDQDRLKKISNLIQAAKIQQQHAEFASCIDKSQRALALFNDDKK